MATSNASRYGVTGAFVIALLRELHKSKRENNYYNGVESRYLYEPCYDAVLSTLSRRDFR